MRVSGDVGTACIPAAYWLARFALTRWQALSVALLVAVSYHLVFFSQNARGYTAHIFFSLVTSGLVLVASTRRRGNPVAPLRGAQLPFLPHADDRCLRDGGPLDHLPALRVGRSGAGRLALSRC